VTLAVVVVSNLGIVEVTNAAMRVGVGCIHVDSEVFLEAVVIGLKFYWLLAN